MKTIDIVKLAREKGHRVTYKNRSDGGIVVTSIDGIKITGNKGNQLIRQMTGHALSERQISQRAKITQTKGSAAAKRQAKGYSKVSEELKKKLRRTQRIWNKEKVNRKKGGSVTLRGIRYILEHEGEAAAIEALTKAEQYARGIAYEGNVTALAERLRRLKIMTNNTSLHDRIEEVAVIIEDSKSWFKEEWIAPINEILYDCETMHDENMILPTLEKILKIMNVI